MTRENVSVTVPVGQAIERTRLILFRPFDFTRWFVIGFCAWLSVLGEGGGFHSGYNFGGGNHGGPPNFNRWWKESWRYVHQNLYWILPVAIGVVTAGIAVWLVLLWLNSRGRFMFLHCVALNKAEVREPWGKFAREANSLFVFRILLGVSGAVIMLPMVAGAALSIMSMAGHGAPDVVGVLAAVSCVFLTIVVGCVWAVIGKLTRDFVVPIQFARRSLCLDAWRSLFGLLRGNPGSFIVYLLFQIILAMAISLLIVIVVLATCCIAGCLFAIPYLGTVLLLPVLVFGRSYSIHYLAQYGPEFDVTSAA